VVAVVDLCLLLTRGVGGLFMAKAEAAPAPKMTFRQLSSMRLNTVDAMFFLVFGLIAIGLAVGIQLR
jgi:hypothetical protein